MTTLHDAVALAAAENGLAVVSTVRADGTVQASLVNVGILPHPESGQDVLGFTTYGKVNLANLRARPQLAITFRTGWQWATVEGRADSPVRTTHGPGSPPTTNCGSCSATFSPPRAAPTTTGTSTTASWPGSGAPSC